jgi:hypothetical protein
MKLIQDSALVAPPDPGRAASPPRFAGTASAAPLPATAAHRPQVSMAVSPGAGPHC